MPTHPPAPGWPPLFGKALFDEVDQQGLVERWPAHRLEPGEGHAVPPGQLLYVTEGCVGLRLDAQGPLRAVGWPPYLLLTQREVVVEALSPTELWVFPWDQLHVYAGAPGWPAFKAGLVQAALFQRGRLRRQQSNRLASADWTRQWPQPTKRPAWAPHTLRLRLTGLPFQGTPPPLRPGLTRTCGLQLFVVGQVEDLSWTRSPSAPRFDVAFLLEPLIEGLFVHRAWAEDLEALVHGRRRYGLPFSFGLIEPGPSGHGTAVVAGGELLATLHTSRTRAEAYPSLLGDTPGRLLAWRSEPLDGGREGLIGLDLPALQVSACSLYGWTFDDERLSWTRSYRPFTLEQDLELYPARWEAP